MPDIIRLIRISLAIRLVVALPGLIGVTLSQLPAAFFALISVTQAFPSMILLIISFAIQPPNLSHAKGQKQMRWLLIMTIAVAALEVAAMPFVFQYTFNELVVRGAIKMPEAMRQFLTAGFRLPLEAPLFFVLLPTVLGAWLSGRRGHWRWSLFAIGIVFIGMVIGFEVSGFDRAEFRISQPMVGIVPQALVVFVVCYFVATLADRQRAEHAALEVANRRLETQSQIREQLAITRERMRVARDLHDTLAHSLAAVMVQIDMTDAVLEGEQPHAREVLASTRELVREGLDNTRQVIGNLRVNLTQDLGFIGTLQQYIDTFQQRSKMSVRLVVEGDEPNLNQAQSDGLFRIVQESLNNVQRHAQAQNVIVQIAMNETGTLFTMRVQDDGIGFNPTTEAKARFGIRGMRERAEAIGAHLRIDSTLGKGSEVIVTLPF